MFCGVRRRMEDEGAGIVGCLGFLVAVSGDAVVEEVVVEKAEA